MSTIDPKWTLSSIPPKGHKDVAAFAHSLFDIAKMEKERLGKPGDFLSNYALYRGKQSTGNNTLVKAAHTPVNLYFANIERTVSNITARQPVGEVVDLDGIKDDAQDMLSVKLLKWWKDTSQQAKTRATARTMEIYGITVEKPYWAKDLSDPNIMLTDPFAFFPAPGNWDDMSTEPPYVCFAYLDFVDKTEKEFSVSGVAQDDAYQLLGTEREKYKADNYTSAQQRIGNYEDPMYKVGKNDNAASDQKIERCLIIEVWVRDKRIKNVTEEMPVLDDADAPLVDDQGRHVMEVVTRKEPVYPDGIRKITITQRKGDKKAKKTESPFMVLDDCANPNINPNLEVELAQNTHPWGRIPVYTANSYRDLISPWGFAAAEQVGDLIIKINLIVSKLVAYVLNVMTPPLIIQKHCGISRAMIESSLKNSGRLVLMPTTPNARIEFMEIPNLPSTFFQVLDLIIKLFDRVSQIEDADRGEAPNRVVAASAIVALQERNQEVRQSKTTSIESLVEQRSRWAIGLWQNFGTKSELVEVGGEPQKFVGTQFAYRKFSYVVESGSTTPRTSLQIQEMAQKLFELKAIDQEALLEALNFPGWKEIIKRAQMSMFDQIIEILLEMGMPEEQAMQLQEMLMELQDDLKSSPNGFGAGKPKPGTPKAQQGKGS